MQNHISMFLLTLPSKKINQTLALRTSIVNTVILKNPMFIIVTTIYLIGNILATNSMLRSVCLKHARFAYLSQFKMWGFPFLEWLKLLSLNLVADSLGILSPIVHTC